MSLLDGLRHRLYVLVRGERYAREVERELRFHLELETIAASARDVRAAELEARRNLGNLTYYREEVRRMTLQTWWDRIRQDASYAWRGLLRTPGFTAVVIATLGLGLGVNTAMYSFLQRLFVQAPGGVVAPNGVRRLYIKSGQAAAGGRVDTYASFSYPRFDAVRQRAPNPAHVAAFTPSGGTLLNGAASSDSTRVSYVTPEYFGILGLRPAIGRFFAADEGRIEIGAPVAVISNALWHRVFNADPGVLGRVIMLKKTPFTIVGVAPPNFSGVETNLVEIWLPLGAFPATPSNGRVWYMGFGNYLRAIARADSAATESGLVSAGSAALRNSADDARPDTTLSLLTGPIIEARGPEKRASELTISTRLAGVSLIVLVIACANVANMLLLRASSRRREIAVRRALGVSRSRLYGQLLTESVMLGLLSGVVALLFATWAGAALRKLLLPTVHWASSPIGTSVILVTVVAAVLTGLVAGLFPAFGAGRVDLTTALKAGARDRGYRRARTQSTLLVVQTALSVVLLVGAGLFVRSLDNVRSVDIGYDADGLLVMNTFIREEAREQRIGAELVQIAERLRSRPGVVQVATSVAMPMGGNAFQETFVPGQDSAVKIGGALPSHFTVSPGFFAASGARIVAGRDFSAEDRAGAAPVMIMSRLMARSLWPNEDPLGKCLIVGKATNPCRAVVGVAEDVHSFKILEDAAAQYYLPLAQKTDAVPSSIVARVGPGQLASTVAAIRADLLRVMPDPSEFAVRSMDQVLERELRPWRMGAILFTALGLLALVVASIGIYGVVAYAMSQRTHEVGVRIALGARTTDVLGLVVREGVRLVVVGVAVGVAAALLLGRFVASLLYGIAPADPSVYVVAAATMCVLAFVASGIPGWRAARVDPVTALRAD